MTDTLGHMLASRVLPATDGPAAIAFGDGQTGARNTPNSPLLNQTTSGYLGSSQDAAVGFGEDDGVGYAVVTFEPSIQVRSSASEQGPNCYLRLAFRTFIQLRDGREKTAVRLRSPLGI